MHSGAAGRACGRHLGGRSEACELIVDNTLDQGHFLIAQFLELSLTAPIGQSSIILPYEHHQVLSNPVRHFYLIHDAAGRFVVTAQIVDLMRQILLDGAPNPDNQWR